MNVLEKVAKKLADMAQEMADMAEAELTIPKNEYSLTEAATRLRNILGPESTVQIHPPVIDISPTGRLKAQDWVVWHAHKSYRGNTIAAAVNKCLAAQADSKIAIMPAEQVEELYAAAAPEF